MVFSRKKLYCVFLLLAGVIAISIPVVAQDEESIWDEPQNVSQSGGASSPILAIDGRGVSHLFWEDSLDGYVYRSGDLDNLSDVQQVVVPFTSPAFVTPQETSVGEPYNAFSPSLVSSAEAIHAFWVDEERQIRYSDVLPEAILDGRSGWGDTITLADNALRLDAAVAQNGRLHLIYIRTARSETDTPGLFHRFSDDGGDTWSEPVLLYASPYFRTALYDETHITIETSGDTAVFVALDNRSLEQLLLIQSGDGGAVWNEPQIVKQRQPSDPEGGYPSRDIDVLPVSAQEIHLAWVAGDAEDANTCVVEHQFSQDGGATWSGPIKMTQNLGSCPQAPDLILSETNLVLLLTIVNRSGYLQAWNGEQWTTPEVQPNLGTLRDPVTFRNIQLNCRDNRVTPDNELLVLGCGDDIWLLKRPLGALNDWLSLFEATPIWQEPVSLLNSQLYLLPGDVVAGPDGRIHSFWSQSDDVVAIRRLEEVTTEVGPDIYYARLHGGEWGAPRPILTSPIGKADQLTAAFDTRGGIYIAWSSGKDGGIYLSRSIAERASSASEWVEPVLLPAPQTTGSYPDILVDGTTLYVAYTIPFNEDRGIYLTRSDNSGATWSEPVRVFDGEAKQWQLVGRPKLARTLDGVLHITWTRDVPTSNSTLSLVYARSEDGGETWSEPSVITDETVVWADIVGIGQRSVHRVWQALSDNRVLLWHQVSYDNGLTWSQPMRVSNPAMDSGPAALVLGVNATPHLLQLAQTIDAELFLLEWHWDGARWIPSEQLELSSRMVGADSLFAVYERDSQTLGVLYGSLIVDPATTDIEDSLIYTSRILDETAVEATPLPTLTPTPMPSATATPTPQPSATPQIDFTDPQFDTVVEERSSPMAGIISGVIPALGIVLIVFVGGVWWTRRG